MSGDKDNSKNSNQGTRGWQNDGGNWTTVVGDGSLRKRRLAKDREAKGVGRRGGRRAGEGVGGEGRAGAGEGAGRAGKGQGA